MKKMMFLLTFGVVAAGCNSFIFAMEADEKKEEITQPMSGLNSDVKIHVIGNAVLQKRDELVLSGYFAINSEEEDICIDDTELNEVFMKMRNNGWVVKKQEEYQQDINEAIGNSEVTSFDGKIDEIKLASFAEGEKFGYAEGERAGFNRAVNSRTLFEKYPKTLTTASSVASLVVGGTAAYLWTKHNS